MRMCAGNDGGFTLITCRACYLYIELLCDTLFHLDADTLLVDILFAGFQCLWCQVFQHLQLIVALAD